MRKDQRDDLLKLFREQRRDARHRHSVWQDIVAKNIHSAEFLNQKMEYIHSNPISKDWELVEERAEYEYASACFYDKGITPVILITDINEWLRGVLAVAFRFALGRPLEGPHLRTIC